MFRKLISLITEKSISSKMYKNIKFFQCINNRIFCLNVVLPGNYLANDWIHLLLHRIFERIIIFNLPNSSIPFHFLICQEDVHNS